MRWTKCESLEKDEVDFSWTLSFFLFRSFSFASFRLLQRKRPSLQWTMEIVWCCRCHYDSCMPPNCWLLRLMVSVFTWSRAFTVYLWLLCPICRLFPYSAFRVVGRPSFYLLTCYFLVQVFNILLAVASMLETTISSCLGLGVSLKRKLEWRRDLMVWMLHHVRKVWVCVCGCWHVLIDHGNNLCLLLLQWMKQHWRWRPRQLRVVGFDGVGLSHGWNQLLNQPTPQRLTRLCTELTPQKLARLMTRSATRLLTRLMTRSATWCATRLLTWLLTRLLTEHTPQWLTWRYVRCVCVVVCAYYLSWTLITLTPAPCVCFWL